MVQIRNVKDDTPRGPFPAEGIYPATIDDAYEDVSSAGNDMCVLTFNVHADGRTVKKKYWLVYSNLGRVVEFGKAIARPGDPDDIPASELRGRECRVKIKHGAGRQEGVMFANVDGVLPASAADAQLASRTAATAPAQGTTGEIDDDELPF